MPELRDELLSMAEVDQSARRALRPGDSESIARLTEIDASNTARIREIVGQHGWPGKSLVGERGAHAAWLLVQHADRDPAFQKSCLPLLEAAVTKGEAQGQHLAYLTDRILVAGLVQAGHGRPASGERPCGRSACIRAAAGPARCCRLRSAGVEQERRMRASMSVVAAMATMSAVARGFPGVTSFAGVAISLLCAGCSDRLGPYQHGTITASCGPAGGPAVSAVLTVQSMDCAARVPTERLELYLPGWSFDPDGAIRRPQTAIEAARASVCSGDTGCSAASLVDVAFEVRDAESFTVDYELEGDRAGRAVGRRCGEPVHRCL